jgi:hypothetical protein
MDKMATGMAMAMAMAEREIYEVAPPLAASVAERAEVTSKVLVLLAPLYQPKRVPFFRFALLV